MDEMETLALATAAKMRRGLEAQRNPKGELAVCFVRDNCQWVIQTDRLPRLFKKALAALALRLTVRRKSINWPH